MRSTIISLFSLLLLLSCKKTPSLSLPALFSDNMVLQRNASVQFWGVAGQNTEVLISTPWGNHKGKTDDSGKWQIGFSTPNENPSFNIDVCSSNECIKINNVVLGEVWLASGQSNMEMPLKGWPPGDTIINSTNEIAQAGNYKLHFFSVERDLSNLPLDDVNGKWLLSDSINAPNFSATAYFFAKELFQELDVPIGIIDSSWGGTPVESWTGINALRETKLYDEKLANFSGFDEKLVDYEQWLAPLTYFPMPDADSTHEDWKELSFNDIDYANEAFNDSNWFDIKFPGNFNDVFGETIVNDFDGVVWVRKSFYLDHLEDVYFLDLGLVDDMDFTYINGVFVGSSFQAESFRKKRYEIPAGLLKKGENVIAIRLIDTMGPARVWSPISIKSNNVDINLEGLWKVIPSAELYENNFYRLDANYVKTTDRPGFIKVTPFTPTVLYNAMIHPLVPFTIKGAIWYQGESNVGFEDEYERTFQAMIEGWRKQWKYEFPFYFVQIAPFDYENDLSAALRNAQYKSTATSKTGIVSTLDLGNVENIHPANKMDVGKRLANLALGNDYGLGGKLRASKPTSVMQKMNKLIVQFDCQDGGSVSVKPIPTEIEISADNIIYYPAKVIADGCSIIVSSSKVSNPKYVRHAWSDIGTGSIVNEEGEAICTFLLTTEIDKKI
ncbi:sialate O-acetylesterase [Flavobacteriaceae bacterium]|nr:sialate O-acetylesterase [Flavobacteriaceae bacterium]